MDFDGIKSVLFPQIILNIDPSQYDELEEQCGIPPPLREPEALNFHQTVNANDIFGHSEDFPAPDYLDEE